MLIIIAPLSPVYTAVIRAATIRQQIALAIVLVCVSVIVSPVLGYLVGELTEYINLEKIFFCAGASRCGSALIPVAALLPFFQFSLIPILFELFFAGKCLLKFFSDL